MAEQISVEVIVDLDPVPGAFHTEESAQKAIQAILLDRIPHYHPIVMPPIKTSP